MIRTFGKADALPPQTDHANLRESRPRRSPDSENYRRLLVGQQHLDWHKAMNAEQPRGGRNSLDDAMAYFNRLEDISHEEWDRNRRKEADLQSTCEPEIRNRAYEFYLHREAEQVQGEQHGDCRRV